MALEGFQPFVLRTFGGLCTSIDRLSLGVGMSPNCTNVRFDPGTVGSRYGYEQFLEYGTTAITTASPMYSIRQYTPPIGSTSILYLTALGATTGTLGNVASGGPSTTLLSGLGYSMVQTIKTDSVLGALYITIPTGYDGTAAGSIPRAAGKTRTYRYVGGTTPAIPRQIAPSPPAWKTDATHYVKASAGAGGLAVGNHYYVWLFQNKDGYITAVGTGGYFNVPDIANTWVEYKNAPIGPANTVARILAITPVDDVNLFWVPNKTVFMDDTTHTGTLTVSEDEVLSLGEPVRPYATVHTPGAPTGCVSYADRLCLWGVIEKAEQSIFMLPAGLGTPSFSIIGLPNLDFKGGYSPDTPTIPGYWVPLAGTTEFVLGSAKDTLLITGATVGHGVSVTSGIDGVYLRPGSVPNVRVRARWGSRATDAKIDVTLVLKDSSGTTIGSPQPSVTMRSVLGSTDYEIYKSSTDVELVSLGAPPLTAASATLTVSCPFTFVDPLNTLEIDWIEIFDERDYSWQSTLRFSRTRDPETFDYATGVASVAPDDGERIRNCFRLRDSLYVAKDRSLYVTRDTGEEPIAWPFDLIDKQCGTPSPHGVGFGDGWVVILSRTGLVLFDGASPQVISQEITPTWNTIDWTDPCFAWVVVDPSTKQIKIGARTTAFQATGTVENNLLLCLDYTEGFGNPVPSGQGRKWSIDTVKSKTGGANVATYHQGVMALDSYGTPRPIYSMSATPDDGTVSPTRRHNITYQKPDETTTALLRNDWPQIYVDREGAIDSTYETAPVGEEIGRSTFDKVVLRARGDGAIATSFVNPDASVTALQAATLITAPVHDIELGANNYHTSEGVRVNSNTKSGWFSLRRLGLFLKNSTYGSTRGKIDSTSA